MKSAVPMDGTFEWTASADLGILAVANYSLSHYYSLGNKIGEYIVAGLPIAVSNFPELRKVAIDDDLGVVFDQEDSKNISKAIVDILDPETYSQKKKNVMEKKDKYCWEYEENKLIELYSKIH